MRQPNKLRFLLVARHGIAIARCGCRQCQHDSNIVGHQRHALCRGRHDRCRCFRFGQSNTLTLTGTITQDQQSARRQWQRHVELCDQLRCTPPASDYAHPRSSMTMAIRARVVRLTGSEIPATINISGGHMMRRSPRSPRRRIQQPSKLRSRSKARASQFPDVDGRQCEHDGNIVCHQRYFVGSAAGTTGTGVSGSGTNTLTLTGTITQINNLLAGSGSATLSYVINSWTHRPLPIRSPCSSTTMATRAPAVR